MAMANTNINIMIFYFFLFIFTQIHRTLSAFPTITTTSSNETDFQSLLDFKHRIQSDPSHFLDSWNHSIHFCEWQGITCGRKHKRVTVLNVSSLDLVGTLSPSIGNLTFLRKIFLYKNSFYGLIPQEIGNLFRLRNLGMINNSFEGQIPANLSSCRNLRFIQLYGNKLSGRIPHQLSILANLLHLGLGGNNFIGSIPPSFGNISTLQALFLEQNSFHGLIPHEISSLFRLQVLVLGNNSFEGLIPANLSSCKDLQLIEFHENKLSGRIPDQLSDLPNLDTLVLSKNFFSGSIPPSLGNISTLRILTLDENNLSENIPHELCKLFKLEKLDLGQNKLSGTFPPAIYNISSIQFLSIPYNHLTGQFPDSLGLTLPKMKIFEIEGNYFSGSIPSTLSNASNLEIIEIGENNLTGPIPRNLGRLQHLQSLQFDNIPLRNIDISFIATLTNCTNLVWLDLSGIEMGGVLPLQISNLSTKLTFFRLANNHISGNLPEGIGELVGLNYFDARSNILSGSIPLSIGKLTNMKQLYLNDNKFEGQIPPSIGDVSGLLILTLGHNMLTGTIPLSLSNLTQLEALDLSYNHLNGSLPRKLFSITSLSHWLYLQDNKFTGPLPLEIGNLKQLHTLSISTNELSGKIPISIGDCVMLVELYLEGNFLDGTIPLSLGQLKNNIDIMDLSQNNLSGNIPTSLENLKFTGFLNLSFNMLEGGVPKNGVFANATAFSIAGNGRLCGGIKSLNLHECPTKHLKKHGKLSTRIIIILVICILIAMVSLFGCIYAIYRTRKSKRLPTSSTSAYDKQLLQISYAEILTCTDGFSFENLIGEGKYGSVYRGVLSPNNKLVAIKVLKLQMKGAHKSFMAECEALRNIRHINLVKIITSCSSIDFKGNDFKALILEYVPNGSLEEWMHQNPSIDGDEKKLNFLEMLNIAIDVATALDYLHNHSGNPIVHCDIKPSNILLGNDLRGLVSDFGLAKFLPTINEIAHDIESTSIGIRGTIGYVAPEYGMGGDVSTKGDIYSYGILLLEMFTGKRPTNTMFTDDFTLHNYVKTAFDQRVVEIIDPRLLIVEDNEENRSNNTSTMNIVESCCLSIFQVGISCSSKIQNERMDIKDALIELQHIRNKMH